jgi:hypothetical protein
MLGGSLKEFDYSWDDQDPEQISDLVEGEYDNSLDSIEKHGISNDEDEDYDDSGLCSCGDGGKQRECEDCKHDLECRESHCDNEEHQRVLDFGYPELCECFKTRSEETCLGCGHATTCESEELEFCFELRRKADMRAIERWQEANPGNDLTWPDHADLCVWLMDKAKQDAARIEQLQAALYDMMQLLPRAEWYYLKPETRAALGNKNEQSAED